MSSAARIDGVFDRRPPRCKDMIGRTDNISKEDFVAYPPLSGSLPQGAREIEFNAGDFVAGNPKNNRET
jgi:hypothetical protein